ncbi:MAG: FkbM family methyltransferase [Patescibacteria group bacterium]
MKEFLKKHIPKSAWEFARTAYFSVADFIANLGPAVRSRKYSGISLYYNKGNAIVRRLKREPVFEMELCDGIVAELQKKENPVFLDVGANIGLISFATKSKVSDVQIFAFEPGMMQRELLNLSVEKNAVNDLEIFPEALGDKAGETEFFIHDPKHAGTDGLMDTGRADGGKSVRVQIITLDEWAAREKINQIDVIKIDTEGAELLVLKGGRETILKYKPVIFLEIEPRNLKAYSYTHDDILAWFIQNGYELFTLKGSKIKQESLAAILEMEDTFIAKPRV